MSRREIRVIPITWEEILAAARSNNGFMCSAYMSKTVAAVRVIRTENRTH